MIIGPNKFLVKAKINTYASGGESKEKILIDGSKEFIFEEKEFKYRDRYFGYNPFIGQEIVWQNGKIIWGMNYYGEVILEIVPTKEIYQFLREELKRVPRKKPFRGPSNYRKSDFRYVNKVKGKIERFEGQEFIFYKKQLVYKLSYQGGLIKEK
jgi:hypothetical protein